jgi:hypothetical protein
MALNINKVLKLSVKLTPKPVTCKQIDITKHYPNKGTNMDVTIKYISSACSYSNQVAMIAMVLVVILEMCLCTDFELLDSSAQF